VGSGVTVIADGVDSPKTCSPLFAIVNDLFFSILFPVSLLDDKVNVYFPGVKNEIVFKFHCPSGSAFKL